MKIYLPFLSSSGNLLLKKKNEHNRFFARQHFFYFSCVLLFAGNILTSFSFAQYCTPVTANYCCGFGITKVIFNTINNSSANASAGYQNFTSQQTSVFVGQNYSIFVKCDVPSEHNVKAWIDWNNDQVFDDVNEVILSKSQVFTCTASVNIPSYALLNTALRMRVAADYYLEAVPTPCDSLERGQAEDYTVIVLQNTSPPVAAFSADNLTSCTGNIQFTDNSTNIPTQWQWDFGDGGTSFLQNPSHTYALSGNFSVTLIATNSNGSDTLVKSGYISVNLAGQLTPAACTPVTVAHCCNYGIYNVSFNTINNSTAGGSESYKDYSCTKNTVVTEGMIYNFQVSTGPDNPEDLRVWLDLNNDGILNDSTERIFTSWNSKIHSGTINIPAAGTFGTPLRLRITSESVGNPVSSCTDPLFGQTEDYGVTVLHFSGLPTANFTVDNPSTCTGTINFTDLSYGLPSSWYWDFGDGTFSNLQNPSHTYSNSGLFTVMLVVTNQNGSDTLIKPNYISFNQSPKPTTCFSPTSAYCCGMGIVSVQLNNISNNTPDGLEGYKDYSCQVQTTLAINQSYNISVVTGNDYDENVRVWIDFDNNGNLDNFNELVFSSDNVFTYHSGSIYIPGAAVTGEPLRMRVSSDYGVNPPPLPCQPVQYAQAEDYAVILVNPTSAPVADFTADSTQTCSGVVNFTDLSANTPTAWFWDFGDGGTSNLKNPQHSYINNGTYTVALTVTNPAGNNTNPKYNYITKSNIYCSVGIHNPENSNPSISVYPNPNNGVFTIQGLSGSGKFSLFNILGERIFSGITDSGNGLYSVKLPPGMYFLEILEGEIKRSGKVIIESQGND